MGIYQKLQNWIIEIRIKNLKRNLPKDVHERTSFADSFEPYGAICKLAAENDYVFKVFKRARDYRHIVEGVSKKHGCAYLNIIRKEGRDLLAYFPRFKENDLLGNPIKFNYGRDKFSPTTLRYIKVLADLRNIFGNLDDFRIVEIGGGYGGQCKIISDVVNYKSYAIIDLDIVVSFIQKYLGELNVKKFICLKQNQISGNEKYDLAISNYAFSECVKKVQDEYITKILYNSKRGYITYNYLGECDPNTHYNKDEIIALLSKVHNVQILDERPKTSQWNFIITWDDTNQP